MKRVIFHSCKVREAVRRWVEEEKRQERRERQEARRSQS